MIILALLFTLCLAELKEGNQRRLLQRRNMGTAIKPKVDLRIYYQSRRWPEKTLKYKFDSSMNAYRKTEVRRALAEMKEQIGSECISFVECPNCDNDQNGEATEWAVPIYWQAEGCSAKLGFNKYAKYTDQYLKFGGDCFKKGTIMHEVMHVLGVAHTQTRSDRNDFINVNEDNIEPGKEDNFERKLDTEFDDFDLPYDFNSIMHYGSRGWGKKLWYGERDEVITVLDDYESKAHLIGQRERLSKGDVDLVRRMYDCKPAGFQYCGDDVCYYSNEVDCNKFIDDVNEVADKTDLLKCTTDKDLLDQGYMYVDKQYCRDKEWILPDQYVRVCELKAVTVVLDNKYVHYPRKCVNGNNLGSVYKNQSLEGCSKLCLMHPSCQAFEYGVNYHGSGGYEAKDCQLNRSTNHKNCNGEHYNLDLYVKS